MPRILIVEDDDDLQYLYKMTLARRGYEVIVASNGSHAMLRLTNELFDLIILDMNLPDLSGIRLIEFARDDTRLKTIPIVVISANDLYQGTARDLGVQHFFVKPMSLQRLAALADDMLHNGQQNGE